MIRPDAVPAIDRPVIVIGAGGHAKVLVAVLRRLNARVLGLTDSDPSKKDTRVLDVPVLGDDSVVAMHEPGSVLLVNGIGATGRPIARREVYERFAGQGFRFAALVDPLALIAGPVEIGTGAQILAGAVVQPDVSLGADCIVNTRASVDHDCVVGLHAHVAPGATLSGGVHVGNGALVGAGATIVPNVHIGEGAVVGAGSVVVTDVPDHATFVGVPAGRLDERGRP